MVDTMPYIPVESRPAKPKRRFFTAEQKKCIVEEALAVGASVSRIARAYDVNANQVFKWVREYQRIKAHAAGPKLLPVVIDQTPDNVLVVATPASTATGTIDLHLAKGRICLNGSVDADVLRVVLAHLAA